MPLALALALLLGADAHADLTLVCDGCFGMQVDLDGEHLLQVAGLGTAKVQSSKLDVGKNATFRALAPGLHHLSVTLLDNPLQTRFGYDGQIYLRPGASMTFQVGPSALKEI